MNATSNTLPEPTRVTATGYRPATRTFYWSVRRELWENRSIYIAPLIVAGVELFGFLRQLNWAAGTTTRRSVA